MNKTGSHLISSDINSRLRFFIYLMGGLILAAGWIEGIALAVGAESTAIAITFPFWAWFLVAERFLENAGILWPLLLALPNQA
jgi:hypothetical protein